MPAHLYHATLPCPLNAREAFLRLRQYSGCVWLDSARSNPHGDGRFSLVAARPLSRLRFTDGRLERTDYPSHAATNPSALKDGESPITTQLPASLDPLSALADWLSQAGLLHSAQNPQEETEAASFFRGGAVGYFSYEFGRQWEAYTRLPAIATGLPHMDWALYDRGVVYDRQSDSSHIVACSTLGVADARIKAEALLELLLKNQPQDASSQCANAFAKDGQTPNGATPEPAAKANAPVSDNAADSVERRSAYVNAVERTRAYIAQGDIYQTNIIQHFSAPLREAPADLYLRLRELNPAPYAAYLDTGVFQILSSSPELFLQKRGRQIRTRPIKGTRPRAPEPAQDERLRHELLHSEKERAELLMIVDLERNDLGRVCEPGSVQVQSLYRVETYATVHHLVADVCGTLAKGVTLGRLLRATFPGGSITGAPKVRAMQIIDELEPSERGICCGAIGLIGAGGSLDLNIAIRTLLCAPTAAGKVVCAGVGAGLVWDSDPHMEYEETLHKAEALLKAINTQPS